MKALVLEEYNRFACREVPRPDVGPEDVLVRVRACGICGSDVHGMDGSTGRRRPPIVMGHEAAGEIAETGESVRGWSAGERVTFDSTVWCGTCAFCRRGEVNLCDDRRVLGVSCEEYRRDGAMAEFVSVPARILYRLPDGVSFERAALVEPLSVAVHAVGRAGIRLGEVAVVVGTGMVGLLVLQAARAAGCGAVVAVDVDSRRLQLARELGADLALDPRTADVPREVRALTGGRGADVAFEVVGVTDAVATAAASLRKGGRLVLVGNVSPRIELHLQAAVTRELSLLGSCASSGEYPACLDLIARGKVRVDPLVSAAVPLAEGAEWFRRLRSGGEGLLKVLLIP